MQCPRLPVVDFADRPANKSIEAFVSPAVASRDQTNVS
jgi:hypothetical protein